MADFPWFLLFLAYLVNAVVFIEGAGFDLTCFNKYPLLLPDDNNNHFIGGYKGGPDYAQMDVAFSRCVDTGTGSGLPTGHSEGDYNNGRSRRLLMPVEGGIERIGAFNCEGDQNGESNNIIVITIHNNGDPRSQQVTITASLGDRVTLEVTRDETSKSIRWSKDGAYVSDFDDQTTVVFESVTLANAGIYDSYYDGERTSSRQAIIRLIVRECPVRYWGPDCSNDCPFCYNGGVCDDNTGNCICAPGFGGTYCDQIFGRNTFGQEGDHHCSGSSPNSSPGCMGKQLCALDPYGCSCAAGFMGRDCHSECGPGTYGADCKQTCHCADGPTACEYATGTCKTGLCSDGWIGDNCQVCETGVRIMAISSISSTSVHVSWISPVNDVTFIIQYKLKLTDQCQPETTNPITLPLQSDASVTISGLLPYSTYEITVTSETWPPCLLNDVIETFITDEAAPSQEPQNARVTVQQETLLTLQWDPIQCGYRGGDNIMYEYSINTSPPRSGTLPGTFLTVQNLDACAEYVFKIKATNVAGSGPEASINATTKNRVPASVDGLTVTKITYRPDELQVTWNSVECSNVYTVLYSRISIDQCLNITEPYTRYWDGDYTSVTIIGLDPYTAYEVVVFSNNSLGYGESSEHGVTDIVVPSGSPENVKLRSQTNTSLTFEWSRVPCGQRGGTNEFVYRLFNKNGMLVATDATPNLFVTVTGLDSCANYSFVVKAFNDKGEGNPSSVVSGVTDGGVLGPVQNLRTDEITPYVINLAWDPQNSSTCDTEEYLVEYLLTNRDQCEDIIEPDRVVFGALADTVVEIFGLYPNSDYTVYITPLNSYGHGIETSITATTSEFAPSGPPENLQVSDVDQRYIVYSWDQPTCGLRNGVVTSYMYTSTSGYQGLTTNTSLLTTGLTPCTDYEFSVVAIVTSFVGPASFVFATTKAEVPDQPRKLTQQDQSLDRMTISWKTPSSPYCEITKYMVTRRTINKPYDDEFVPDPYPEDESEVHGTITHHTFVDLEPSTEYEIQVWAFTEAGPGDLSKNVFYTAAANTTEYLGEPLKKPRIKDTTDTTLTTEIPQIGDPEIYITDFQILVEEPDKNIVHNTPDFNHKTYIAGKVDLEEVKIGPVKFVVGYGSPCSSNPPLVKGTRYVIYIGTCSAINDTVAGCIWSTGRSYTPGNDSLDSVQVILVIFTTVSLALFISISLIAVWLFRKNKTLQQQLSNQSKNAEMTTYTNLGVVRESGQYEDLNTESTDDWNIAWSHLNISDTVLGGGNFGEVREGTIIVNGEQQRRVAVKRLNSNASAKDKDDFNSELDTMKRIGHHPNVVGLIGACDNKGTLYVAIELVSSGDLRSYLRRTRQPIHGGGNSLPSSRLLNFALDVARGMNHLSKLGIIHRDLAARNILLDENLVAKVSDFGLSRGQNIYVQTSKQRVPTRWLAIESLCYNTYTSKSDVWSFAVLVWEIATFGATPYSGIPSRDLPQELTDGYRMPKPKSLDNEIYKLMLECWNVSPAGRPSFSKIVQTLGTMVSSKQRNYMDTKAYENIQFPAIEPDRDDS